MGSARFVLPNFLADSLSLGLGEIYGRVIVFASGRAYWRTGGDRDDYEKNSCV